MTRQRYRSVDLSIFTAVALLLDLVVGRMGLFGGRQYFALSTPILIALYVRWRGWAVVPNVLVAFLNAWINFSGWAVFAAHAAGILALAAALPAVRTKPFAARRPAPGAVLLLYVGAYLLMFFVEWGALLAFGGVADLGVHAVNRIFDLLIGGGLLLLMAAQKELLVPMDAYLMEQSERNR